jgi:hypothetical protein
VDDAAWQVVTAAGIGTAFLALVYLLARRQMLSFRYTAGWMTLFAFLVVAVVANRLVVPVVEPVADALGTTPSVLLAVALVLLLALICIQLSISISGMQEQNRRLAERIALLQRRIEDLSSGSPGVPKP